MIHDKPINYSPGFMKTAFFVVTDGVPKRDFPGLWEAGLGDFIDIDLAGRRRQSAPARSALTSAPGTKRTKPYLSIIQKSQSLATTATPVGY